MEFDDALGMSVDFLNLGRTVTIHKNGNVKVSKKLQVPAHWSHLEFLNAASKRLDIVPTAKHVFNADGVEIEDIACVDDGETLFVSKGSKFRDPRLSRANRSKDGGDAKVEAVGAYSLGAHLGEGGFGVVRLGTHSVTGQVVALKFLSKARMGSASAAERVVTEVQCLAELKHPNVIQLVQVLNEPNHVVLALEFAGGGDLKGLLEEQELQLLPERKAHALFKQIVAGVSYAHKHRICHHDLKLENILLTTDKETAKITDFGLSSFFKPGETNKSTAGSLAYLPPEVLRGASNAGPPIDVWALGVVLFALLFGRLPFHARNSGTDAEREASLKQRIMRCEYSFSDSVMVSVEARDLIRRLLHMNPDARMTIPGIYAHPWFAATSAPHTSPGLMHMRRRTRASSARHRRSPAGQAKRDSLEGVAGSVGDRVRTDSTASEATQGSEGQRSTVTAASPIASEAGVKGVAGSLADDDDEDDAGGDEDSLLGQPAGGSMRVRRSRHTPVPLQRSNTHTSSHRVMMEGSSRPRSVLSRRRSGAGEGNGSTPANGSSGSLKSHPVTNTSSPRAANSPLLAANVSPIGASLRSRRGGAARGKLVKGSSLRRLDLSASAKNLADMSVRPTQSARAAAGPTWNKSRASTPMLPSGDGEAAVAAAAAGRTSGRSSVSSMASTGSEADEGMRVAPGGIQPRRAMPRKSASGKQHRAAVAGLTLYGKRSRKSDTSALRATASLPTPKTLRRPRRNTTAATSPTRTSPTRVGSPSRRPSRRQSATSPILMPSDALHAAADGGFKLSTAAQAGHDAGEALQSAAVAAARAGTPQESLSTGTVAADKAQSDRQLSISTSPKHGRRQTVRSSPKKATPPSSVTARAGSALLQEAMAPSAAPLSSSAHYHPVLGVLPASGPGTGMSLADFPQPSANTPKLPSREARRRSRVLQDASESMLFHPNPATSSAASRAGSGEVTTVASGAVVGGVAAAGAGRAMRTRRHSQNGGLLVVDDELQPVPHLGVAVEVTAGGATAAATAAAARPWSGGSLGRGGQAVVSSTRL